MSTTHTSALLPTGSVRLGGTARTGKTSSVGGLRARSLAVLRVRGSAPATHRDQGGVEPVTASLRPWHCFRAPENLRFQVASKQKGQVERLPPDRRRQHLEGSRPGRILQRAQNGGRQGPIRHEGSYRLAPIAGSLPPTRINRKLAPPGTAPGRAGCETRHERACARSSVERPTRWFWPACARRSVWRGARSGWQSAPPP